MNQAELREKIIAQQTADRELLIRKDHDYNGPENSLGGFRDFGFLGVLVRLSDKINRLRSLQKHGSMVSAESMIDTLQDIRNYSHIGQIVWEKEQETKKNESYRDITSHISQNG